MHTAAVCAADSSFPSLRMCAGLGYVGNPWAVLPIELLHGVTFGCAWAAGTLYCSRIAPRGLEATTQALFNVRTLSWHMHMCCSLCCLPGISQLVIHGGLLLLRHVC